ncbi:MAG: DUF1475 family protein [Anaerolineae bacterium]|jgi:hypothetical protein|nr:DUF1475 family protein [Anaerolineae bacterium]
MKVVKWVSLVGVLAMSAALINGFTNGNFSADGALIIANPWGIVSLVDLYVGFILFSGWIIYREKSIPMTIIWVILMMVLGFWTGALYSFLAAVDAKENWQKFWLGKHYQG